MAVLKTYTFDSGSVAEALSPTADWAITNVGTGSNFDEIFNTSRGQSATASGSTIARNTLSVTAAGGADVVHEVYKNTIAADSQGVSFGIQHSGSFSHVVSATRPLVKPASGLAVEITPTGEVHAFYQDTLGSTYLTPAVAFPAIAAQTFYKFRLRHTGGRFQVKVWASSVAEPAAWNVDVAVPATMIVPDGNFWMAAKNVSGNATTQYVYTDNLSISDAPAAAKNNNFTTTPATASLAAPNATVSAGRDARFTTTPATASLAMPAAVVTAQDNNNFTTTAATASLAMPTAGVSAAKTVTFSTTAATASVAMPGGKAAVKTTTTTIPFARQNQLTEVAPDSKDSADEGHTSYEIDPRATTQNWVLYKPDLSSLPADAQIAVAELKVNLSGVTGNGITFAVNSVDATYDPALVTWNTRPPVGTTKTVHKTFTTNGEKTYDVSELLKGFKAGTVFGLALIATSGDNANVTTGNSGNIAPTLTITYSSEQKSLNYTATPATVSVAMVEPAAVSTSKTVSVLANALTASVAMPNAVVKITAPDARMTAAPMTASVAMPGGAFSRPVTFTTTPATASIAAPTPTLKAEKNAVVKAGVATARIVAVPPLQAQGEAADAYFQRVLAQSDVDDIWLRLDETSGTVADNRMGPNEGTYVGGPLLGVFGLENRRGVVFDGVDDYIQLVDNEVGSRNGTFEVVFKTDDANGSLMYGNDNAVFNPNLGGTFVGANFITEVSITDARIGVRFTDGTFFRGTKLVNDNNWHHLVVTWVGTRLEVFLDGALHFARHLKEGQNIVAVPDTFGVHFKGEIMEVVFHKENVLSATDAVRNYYAAFGIVPIQAGVMSASVAMPNAKGKGNQKRALALFYNPDNNAQPNYFDQYNWTGLQTHSTLTGFLKVSHYGSKSFDMGGFKVFPKSVVRDESKPVDAYLGGSYFDEITGDPRYINLATDVDTTDYDLVFFINLPPRLNFNAGYGDQPSHLVSLYENLIDGVRKAQDEDGFNIWAPQPEVAIGLGVVDRVEAHTFARESKSHPQQGNALGLFDARGQAIDPFDGPGFATLAPRAFHYWDTHALNKFRVVANVEGFTDLKGYRLKDYFFGRPRDNFEVPFEAWKYEELTNGLEIGMTEYYQQDFYNLSVTAGNSPAFNKRASVVAVPPANVKAGTVVLRETATHWVESAEVENPYRDYATAIVVQPGDSLKGRPVNGKVFVSFMAGVDDNLPEMMKQLVPANAGETTAQLAWDYSSSRVDKMAVSTTGEASNYTKTTQGYQTDAAIQAAFKELMASFIEGDSKKIFGVIEEERYPTVALKRYTLIERAMNWLSSRVVNGVGDKVVRVSPMTANVQAVNPTVVPGASVTVAAEPMVAAVSMEDTRDAHVHVFPARARVDMTGYSKKIVAEPMTAHVELVDNFDMVHAGGEQVVLYIRNAEAILYLKEDA